MNYTKEELFYMASFNAIINQHENILDFILPYIEKIDKIDFDTISFLSLGAGNRLNSLRARLGGYYSIIEKKKDVDFEYKDLIKKNIEKDRKDLFDFTLMILEKIEKCLELIKDNNVENICALLKLKADLYLSRGQVDNNDVDENKKNIKKGLQTYEISLNMANMKLPKKNYTRMAINSGIAVFYGEHMENIDLGLSFYKRCFEQNDINIEEKINYFKQKKFKCESMDEEILLEMLNKYLIYKKISENKIKKNDEIDKKEKHLKKKALKNSIDG